MQYNKHNLAIHNFCSPKNSPRPEITGILCEPNKTTATDSFTLIQVSTPKDKPAINFQPFILPAETAKTAVKAIDIIDIKTLQKDTIQGEYPKVNELMQEKGKFVEVMLNPAYLEKIAKFYKDFGKEVKMKIPYEPNAPIRFEASNATQTAKAMFMPIHDGTPNFGNNVERK